MGNALGAVSFDTEDLILVDSDDQIVGTAPKKLFINPEANCTGRSPS